MSDIKSKEEKNEKAVEKNEVKKEESKVQQEVKIEDKKTEIKESKPPATKEQKSKDVKKKKVEKEPVIAPAYLNDLNFYPELRTDHPKVKSGDIVSISYLILEGGKEKTQEYKGTVLAIKGVGISKNITVRKVSFGVAVERVFPLNSKFVKSIKIQRHSKVRRAKLYYLRKLRGKASRLKPL